MVSRFDNDDSNPWNNVCNSHMFWFVILAPKNTIAILLFVVIIITAALFPSLSNITS